MPTAVLHDSAFCAYETLRLFADEHNNKPSRIGALASFSGIARAQEELPEEQIGAPKILISLHLDCYPAMALRCLEDIVAEAQARWSLYGATLHHRIGEIPVSETIVLAACLSARRNDAFDACRYMMDMVKVRPPLWKREQTATGERAWLDVKPDDTHRAQRWQSQAGKDKIGKGEAWQETSLRHVS